MTGISSLGYVGFGVSDLARWETLLVDVLGMQVGDRDGSNMLALRMDDCAQRIVLERDERDDIIHVGWLLDTEAELEAHVRGITAKGITAKPVGREIEQRRGVEKAYFCTDPNGLRHEFAVGLAKAATTFRSKVLGGDFVVGQLGVGHILVVAKDYPATLDFMRNVLGLRLTDIIRAPEKTRHGIVQVEAAFYHAGTGRHHSMAAAAMPSSKRLHHMMVEVSDFNDVGRAYDRCVEAGFPIAMGLGHHPNDQMFSFYVVTPSNVLLEFGTGGVVVDVADWEVKTYAQLSDWGHSSSQL